MGQDASKVQKVGRYIPDHDTFKRRIALLRPPRTVMRHCLGIDGYEQDHHACQSNCRLLRSVRTNVVCWNGTRLLPEQWLSVLGNQEAFVYFFDDNVDTILDDATADFMFCLAEARNSSPDAVFYAVHWCGDPRLPRKGAEGGDAKDPSVEERAEPEPDPFDREAEGGNSDDVPEAIPLDIDPLDDVEADKPPEPVGVIDFRKLAKKHGISNFIRIDSIDQLHTMECILAEHFTPMELVRPLACLLYDLIEACDAREAWLLDSATMLPLLSTNDTPITAASPIVGAVRVLKYSLRRMMQRMNCEDLHFMSLDIRGAKVALGWACRPHAYVLMIIQKEENFAIGDALLQANLERYSLHFSNVINNRTLTKQYQPIVLSNTNASSPSPARN